MAENAGKLSVEYVVISDAAMRKLERLQKALDNVEKMAKKHGDAIVTTFKKSGKAMAAFGAIATGVLYGIIRASAYSSMWLDQISHQMTRISTKILEILGLDKAIEFFIKQLDNLADELTNPSENDFWKRLTGNFMDLSLKSKLATVAILLLGIAMTGLTIISVGSWILGVITKFAATALAAKLAAAGIWLLNGAIAVLTSPVTLIIVAILALLAVFTYLWAQTNHGKAQIQSLINMWNNFKQNISDVGWFNAIVQMLKDFGMIWLYGVIQIIKKIYESFKTFFTELVPKFLRWGIGIITGFIDGIKKTIPIVIDKLWYIYDNFWVILTNIKQLAYDKAIEIYRRLVDGFTKALDWVKGAYRSLTNIWNMESDVVVVAANQTGKDIATGVASGIDTKTNEMEIAAIAAGGRASDGLRDGIEGMSGSVCDEMTAAIDCAESGVGILSDAFEGLSSQEINIQLVINGSLNQELMDQVNAALDVGEYVAGGFGWQLSGWQNSSGGGGSSGGGSSGGGGGYVAGGTGWTLSGWQNSALGGHQTRTGSAIVHQGEDIVHLKSLLSGTSDNKSQGDIIINPTINIQSSGISGDPFETNRIADVISKRMGDEVRRITTGI